MKDHVYSYDNLIIGGNLASLVFAFKTGYPIIISKVEIPYSHHFFKIDIELNKFNIVNESKDLITPSGNIMVGLKKEDLYSYLYFLLSTKGQVVLEIPAQTVRLSKEFNLVKIVSERSRLYSYKYKKLHCFTKNIIGLETEIKIVSYELINSYNITRCYKHEYEAIDKQENGVIDFGLFDTYKRLTTSTILEKEVLEKNHHVDFYIKNYLEKYLRTFVINHPRHLAKATCHHTIKREILDEVILEHGDIVINTLSEESIING
jgi:hypothetical protein